MPGTRKTTVSGHIPESDENSPKPGCSGSGKLSDYCVAGIRECPESDCFPGSSRSVKTARILSSLFGAGSRNPGIRDPDPGEVPLGHSKTRIGHPKKTCFPGNLAGNTPMAPKGSRLTAGKGGIWYPGIWVPGVVWGMYHGYPWYPWYRTMGTPPSVMPAQHTVARRTAAQGGSLHALEANLQTVR